jgi:threonine/homoserine/homoserine lactone efflux protein
MNLHINVIMHVVIVDCLAIISPGPDFFMVLRNSLAKSYKAGLYTTLGITLGGGIMFAAGLFGVEKLVSTNKWIFEAIKIFGGTYLIYLALKAILSKVTIQEPQLVYIEESKASLLEYFRDGLICNLTNPKAFMFVIALSAYAATERANLLDNLLIVFCNCFFSLLWFILVAAIFGQARVRKIFYNKQRVMNIFFGCFLLYVASEIIFM